MHSQLLAGVAIAEAARLARLAIKSASDPSWRSYSVYAHPCAPVVEVT